MKKSIFLALIYAICSAPRCSTSNQYAFKLLKSFLDTAHTNQLISPLALKMAVLSLTPSENSTAKTTATSFLYSPDELSSRKQLLLSQYNFLIDSLSHMCNESKGKSKYDCRKYLSRMRLPEKNLTRLNSVQKVERLFEHFEAYTGGGEEMNRLDGLIFLNKSKFGDIKEKGKLKGRLEPFWIDSKSEEKRLAYFWRSNFSILSAQSLPKTHQLLSILQFRQTFAPVFQSTDRALNFTSSSNETVAVEALTSRNNFPCYYSEKLQSTFVQIPYLNPKYNLVIIKPDSGQLASVMKYLTTGSKLPSYLEMLNENVRPLTLTVPKFFGENAVNLTQILTKNNLTNFTVDSGSGSDKNQTVSINQLKQLIYYENLVRLEPESGTTMKYGSRYSQLDIDRPFIYFVTSTINEMTENVEIILSGYFVNILNN